MSYPLPYRRFERRAKTTSQRVWVWDWDETVTAAPLQHARLAQAVKQLGDKAIIVTGHGPRNAREEQADAIGFPFDDIVIVDPGKNGAGKAKCLEQLDAWFCFEDSVQFGPEIVRVCPVTFQYREVAGDIKPKKAAKKAAKILKVGKADPS